MEPLLFDPVNDARLLQAAGFTCTHNPFCGYDSWQRRDGDTVYEVVVLDGVVIACGELPT